MSVTIQETFEKYPIITGVIPAPYMITQFGTADKRDFQKIFIGKVGMGCQGDSVMRIQVFPVCPDLVMPA